jgi:hypothetical protein
LLLLALARTWSWTWWTSKSISNWISGRTWTSKSKTESDFGLVLDFEVQIRIGLWTFGPKTGLW